ncbi:MAG: type II toxin-antitoxin system prevent-host-death family antitoxin [Clostridia bacterium]|nr:type II toxin-antitoxin system prevent-host-death family antitoxin [Clostridia bacterium]
MPNIKPVSDLRNYTEILKEVQKDAPVFLTRNGRGCYAVVDIREYERLQAQVALINELNKGRRSGEEKGWLTAEEVRAHFRDKSHV